MGGDDPPPPRSKHGWSDTLGTMVKIPLGQCLQVPGDVVDKLMVWVGLCAKILSIKRRWVQAQHDSKRRTGPRSLMTSWMQGQKRRRGGGVLHGTYQR